MRDRIFKAFDGVNLSESKRKKVLDNVFEGSVKESSNYNFWQGKIGGVAMVAAAALIFVAVNVVLISGGRNGENTPLNNQEPDLVAVSTNTEADITGAEATVSIVEPEATTGENPETVIEPTTVEIYNAETTGVCSYPINEVEIVVCETETDINVELNFRAPVNNYTITAGFGARHGVMHYGTDMTFTDDKNIYASESGKVIRAEYDEKEGNIVVINHGNGMVSEYSCLESMAVACGSVVEAGDVIGVMGTTGYSTGIHLCWKICVNGEYVDPISLINK